MLKSGRTPLVRARNLEKKLNVGEIYLKLEGQNPSGHKNDRICEVIVKNAIANKNTQLIAYGSLSFIRSIMYFSSLYNIKVIIPMFKNESWKKRNFKDEDIMDFRYIKNPSKLEILKELSDDTNSFLGAEGYNNTHVSQMVLENLVSEIIAKLNYKIDSINIQLGYGYTMTSLYNTFLKNWINDNLDNFPKVYCGTWDDNEKLYKRYLDNDVKNYLPSDLSELENEHIPKESFQMDERLITDTLEAVAETNGIVTSIMERELKDAARLLKRTESISIDYKEAYSIASFIKNIKRGQINKGRHVIILNDAKTMADIKQYDESTNLSIDEMLNMTTNWLAEYRDSDLETKEAIENAIEKGFILLASRNEVYEGICVIVNLGFDNFIPKYHLAYIGTSSKSKGRGIGSELIQRAIDLTDGVLSLHVDLDNKSAKKIYEKYGFKHSYNRMIYYDNK